MKYSDPFISKSKYLTGLQCHKLLWYHYNSADNIPESDEATRAIFETGHLVGNLAKRLYPDGIEVPRGEGPESRAAATRSLLERRQPLFEATVLTDRLYCQVDILVPVENGAWDVVEVKSGASVKPVNLADVTFQAYCLEKAGIPVNRLALMHIDNAYVREGEIDAHSLFHVQDVTEDISGEAEAVPGAVERMLHAIGGSNPDVPIGRHCGSPYECNLQHLCWRFLPTHPVTELRRGKRKAFQFISEGIYGLSDVPTDRLTDRQLIQQSAVRSGRPHIEPERIREWLAELEFPVHCFDFETIFPTLPIFNGTRPYQHVPFQFSLHVLQNWGAEPEHREFLASDVADPRPALIDALRAIGAKGTIVAYNMGFERRRIHELALDFPERRQFLEELVDRFRDLATPFEQFWYYHRDQNGSCSLKSVLPVLTGQTYDELQIGRGDDAAREFLRVVHGSASATEKEEVLASLREYCRQDTKALVDILHALREMI